MAGVTPALLDPTIDSGHRYFLAKVQHHYEELSEGNNDDEDDDTSNAAASQDEPCTIPYCNCPWHKKKGPAPPAPPPAPPAMGGYCGEGSTQFATWGYGIRTT